MLSGTLSLATAKSIGDIAWWAHVGGFIAGIILQFFFVKRGREHRALSRDEYGMDVAWTPAGQWRRP